MTRISRNRIVCYAYIPIPSTLYVDPTHTTAIQGYSIIRLYGKVDSNPDILARNTVLYLSLRIARWHTLQARDHWKDARYTRDIGQCNVCISCAQPRDCGRTLDSGH